MKIVVSIIPRNGKAFTQQAISNPLMDEPDPSEMLREMADALEALEATKLGNIDKKSD